MGKFTLKNPNYKNSHCVCLPLCLPSSLFHSHLLDCVQSLQTRGPPAPHSGTLLCLLSLPVLSLLCSFFAEVNRSCRAAGYYLSRRLHRSVWLLTCYFFSSSSSPQSDFSIGCTINLCSSFSQLSQISSIIIIKHVGCNR